MIFELKFKNVIHGLILIGLIAFQGCRFKQKQTIHVVIQPFKDIPETELSYVQKALEKIVGPIITKQPLPLPKRALNFSKTRYRADSLLRFLSQQTIKGNVTIGLTSNDISTTKNGKQDWGVMGLGYCPGRACIASTFRLKNKNKAEQLFKVAIHELGHTQGLPHCDEKTCFMRDADGKNPTDDEKAFCKKCKKYLTEIGWHLD